LFDVAFFNVIFLFVLRISLRSEFIWGLSSILSLLHFLIKLELFEALLFKISLSISIVLLVLGS